MMLAGLAQVMTGAAWVTTICDGLGDGGVVGGVGWGEGDRESVGSCGGDIASGRSVDEVPGTEAVALSWVAESAVP